MLTAPGVAPAACSRAESPATLADSIAAAPRTSFLLIAAGEVRDEQLVAGRLEQIDPDGVSVWVAEGAQHTGGDAKLAPGVEVHSRRLHCHLARGV